MTRNQLVHSKPATEETKTMKKSEVKVASAVNTQPVADKRKFIFTLSSVHVSFCGSKPHGLCIVIKFFFVIIKKSDYDITNLAMMQKAYFGPLRLEMWAEEVFPSFILDKKFHVI